LHCYEFLKHIIFTQETSIRNSNIWHKIPAPLEDILRIQIENGKLENVTLATKDRILMALDVDAYLILDEVQYDS